jgi:hypothetical protein
MENAIAAAGSVLSLIGVAIAIWQIRKTLRVAEAAQRAAEETQRAITRSVLLTDLSTCTTALEELKALIRGKRVEAALLRVTDLNTQLTQLQSLHGASPSEPLDFAQILTQLSILRELLERKLNEEKVVVNPVQVNTVLSSISDQLNSWIGKQKYLGSRGESDD